MPDSGDEAGISVEVGQQGRAPALQVICLGNSGGPSEENATGLLVHSVASGWAKGSLLAVDAGSHLAPIIKILERDFPAVSVARKSAHSPAHDPYASDVNNEFFGAGPSSASFDDEDPYRPEAKVVTSGPFAGLKFPNESARANALHVLRSYVSTYLITHPHLDHISGFAINTAAFHATSRPKTLAALPSTVDAMKMHIFNDIIWPNLTDEDGGVGFVTFQRLKEGGDVMLGEGEGRGYIDVCDGLGVKAFKVSHGVCTKGPPSHHHRQSIGGGENSQHVFVGDSGSLTWSISGGQHGHFPASGTPGGPSRPTYFNTQSSSRTGSIEHGPCIVDSTAYFVRDCETQREVLIFGDVEPDSLSLFPRNKLVWYEAARKIASSLLGGIFIESSYEDSQADAVLFGHLNPRHLINELQTLSTLVNEAKATRWADKGTLKRKRSGPSGLEAFVKQHSDEERSKISSHTRNNSKRSSGTGQDTPDLLSKSPKPATGYQDTMSPRAPQSATVATTVAKSGSRELPLAGIKVVLIHVKDTLKDGPHVRETVLAQLKDHERRLQREGQGLGCDFIVAEAGKSYWF